MTYVCSYDLLSGSDIKIDSEIDPCCPEVCSKGGAIEAKNIDLKFVLGITK
jgi:hypothetical protein